MTDTTTPSVCPNCQHPHHLPGTECATPVHHGPNRWHLCLCLARPGAALSCPPQMTCQGGTLGYADVWYLQHGHVLVGEDGTIAPGAVQTGVASVGFPSGPDIAAAASAVVPAADRAALRDCIAASLSRYRKFFYWAPSAADMLRADLAEHLAADLSQLPAPADRAAVYREVADRLDADAATGDKEGLTRIYRRSAARKVREWADEAAVDRVAAETPPAETQPRRGDAWEAWLKAQRDEHPRSSHAWFMVDCVLDRYRLHADMGVPLTGHVCEAKVVGDCECLEPGPAVVAQPGKDTETPTPCGPTPSQCDAEAGEPCADHERQQAHAEGEHCFCGPECPDGCTCAIAGDAFVPAGHYADCPRTETPQPKET